MAIYTGGKRRARKPTKQDRLSMVFGALADPTRRAMLERLRDVELSVTELAKPFGVSQPTISKHLKVLENAGLVVQGRDAQWRPRTLRTAPLVEVDAYLERFRQLWDEQFDRLDVYLEELKRER